MHLIITQAHIDAGIQKNPAACPIALALAEKGYTHIEVEPSYIDMVDEDVWFVYSTPEIARQFISAFDDGEKVKPFEFDLKDGEENTIEEWMFNKK